MNNKPSPRIESPDIVARGRQPSDVADLLRDIVDEVRGLRSDLRDRRGDVRLRREDREHLSRLLPAIVGACGSDLFVVHELMEHAAVRIAAADLTVTQVGQLFRRAVDVPINRLVVRRSGSESNRVVWSVEEIV